MNQLTNSIRSSALLAAASSVLLAVSASAQSSLTNSVWTTAGSGNWSDSANWLGTVPTVDNAVVITNASTKTVLINAATPLANRAARRMDINAPAGSTNTLRLENLGANGFFLANTLTIESGGRIEVVNSAMTVDGALGGALNLWAGEIKLSGGTIITTNDAVMRIARNGIGLMEITAGQLLARTNLTVASLSGSDGTFKMSNGLALVDGQVIVGDDLGSVGRINMPGGSLISTNVTAHIGDDGDGTLAISGGNVTFSEASVGNSGVGLITVAGGGLNTLGDLLIGKFNAASGTLAISNGLVHVGDQFSLADNIGAYGHVHVAGGTLIATNSSATTRIGDDGFGTLTLDSGSVLMDDISVGRSVSAVGLLRIQGGTMQAGTVSLGRFDDSIGTLEMNGGTLNLGTRSLHIGREGQGFANLTNGTIYAANVFLASSNISSAGLFLDGATIYASQFYAVSPNSGEIVIQFNSGRIETASSTVSYGAPLVVGDGVRPATLHLTGGTHTFTDGLTISSNATLSGTGTVIGTITVLPGGSNLLGSAPPPSPAILTPLAGAGPFRFSFASTVGRLYDVLATTNPAAPVWQLQTTLPGTGSTLIYTNSSPAPGRFFRVLTH